jgi:hypothetical protein
MEVGADPMPAGSVSNAEPHCAQKRFPAMPGSPQAGHRNDRAAPQSGQNRLSAGWVFPQPLQGTTVRA